jgi:circadian clock protein KaiC
MDSGDQFENLFSQKMPTGIPGLDHLLGGGLTRTNSLLIEGAPGSGKSTLGVQILVEGCRVYQEPGVMVAFEEFPRQLYSEYAAYGFDLQSLEKEGLLRILWTDPRKVIQGFTGKDDLIGRIIDEMGARRLLIDSITHFRRVAPEDIDLREVLYKVLNNLKLKGVNSILIKEFEGGVQDSIAFEEYVVDASIRIFNEPFGTTGETRRTLQIRKTRGQKHLSGFHPFVFSENGIAVYPIVLPSDVTDRIPFHETTDARRSTGVRGFDPLIEGGLVDGSINVVVGYSGTGKTTFGRHFVHERLKEGEKVLVLSFQETEAEYLRNSRGLGLEVSPFLKTGQLIYWPLSPVGLIPEKFFHDLFQRLIQDPVDNLVWDSISDMKTFIHDADRIREANHLLASALHRTGLTAVLMNESHEMSGLIPLGELDFAQQADSITQLSYAEVDGQIHRFIGIMKMVGTNHSKHLHEFQIGHNGMEISKKATGLTGILSGHVAGRLEAVAEEALGPLDETNRDLAEALKQEHLPEELRGLLLKARQNLGIADIVLREHFGLTDFTAWVEEESGSG